MAYRDVRDQQNDRKIAGDLPHTYTVAPLDEPAEHQFRLYVAFGPPGEYGETSLRIPVGHGQPFVLPARPGLKSRPRTGE